MPALDFTSLCLGAAAGMAAGFVAAVGRMRPAKPMVSIDHLVIRANTGNGKLLDDSLRFYQLLGMDLEQDRLDGFRKMQEGDAKGENRKGLVFPCVRLGPETVIDLFPQELEPLFCETSTGQVDHVCFCYETCEAHIQVLERLKSNGVSLSTVGRPWGARGQGFSTYLHDPSGLYLELCNYETKKWPMLQEWLDKENLLGAKKMAIPITKPYKTIGK